MVEMVLDCHVRIGKTVVPVYILYVEHFCSSGKDTGENGVKLFLLDIDLPTDVEKDPDLVVQQIVCISSVLLAIVPDLRELCDSIGIQFLVATPSRRKRSVGIIHIIR